jgi:hypothetical protein
VLTNPDHVLFLDLSAAIGKFHADNQTKKSLLNRIARAKRGLPSGGPLPFGRTFTWADDRSSGTWGVDEDGQRLIADVAARYLAGATLFDLAAEYGTSDAQLGYLLRHRCGPTWTQTFSAPKLGIAETVVETAVPPLLDDDTIRKVGRLLDHRKKRVRRPPVRDNFYLLGGKVFCPYCGYAYTGQARSRDGVLLYRHCFDAKRRLRKCTVGRPEPWVRAEILEQAVVRDLLSLLGNPAALLASVQAALPDTSAEASNRDNLEGRLAEVNRETANLERAIGKGLVSDDEAASEVGRLRERKAHLQGLLDRVNDVLADTPSPEELQRWLGRFHLDAEELTYVKQRNAIDLIAAAFPAGDRMPDDSPVGVYLHTSVGVTPRQYSYQLRGRLLPDAVRLLPRKHCLPASR